MKNILYGDGIHDDTAAIQELIDSSKVVVLPPPEKHYLISSTLRIPSNFELKLDRFTEIKLAPKSNCPMLTNSDHVGGNKRIAISGGIWNANNLEQAPNPQMIADENGDAGCPDASRRIPVPADYPIDPVAGKRISWNEALKYPYHPDRYYGVIWRLVNVDELCVENIILRDPVSYAVQSAKVSNFTFKHITFDFNLGNPSPNNMDGLHFDGFCRNGYIADVKGNCFDDLLAFNAEDGAIESPGFGPIENIVVDGIFADRCHSAVRMLSCGSAIRNITIRNVFGSYYRYAIGFTHFFPNMPRGWFDNIVMENLNISKALAYPEDFNKCPDWGLVWFQNEGDVGSVRISGFHRIEDKTPTPSIEIEQDVHIGQLTVSDASIENHLPQDLVFLQNAGNIGSLYFSGCRTSSGKDAGEAIEFVNTGVVKETK